MPIAALCARRAAALRRAAAAAILNQQQQQTCSSSTSSGSVADQVLAYVRGDELRGRGPQAVDVLRSGLAMHPPPADGAAVGNLVNTAARTAGN